MRLNAFGAAVLCIFLLIVSFYQTSWAKEKAKSNVKGTGMALETDTRQVKGQRNLYQTDFSTDPVKSGWKTGEFSEQKQAGTWVNSPEGTEHYINVQQGFWESPLVKVQPFHYYRLTFSSRSGAGGYWAALFTDSAGVAIQTDVYDSLFSSDEWQEQEFCFRTHALASKVTLRFQSNGDAIAVERVNLSEVTINEVAAWVERFSAHCPSVSYVPSESRGTLLPRAFDRMHKGGRFRILLLGDSIANDTGNSLFEAQLHKLYPKVNFEVVNSVRGGTGCTWYKDENRVQDYVLRFKPDLLIIAGISHNYDAEAIRSVIRQVRAKQNPEILVLSDSITPVSLMTKGFIERTKLSPEAAGKIIDEFPVKLRLMAEEEKVEFLDMRTPWENHMSAAAKPADWFYRDPIHANSRGKQVVGQILSRYFDRSK